MSFSYPYVLADFPQGLRSDQLQQTIEDTPSITAPIIRIDTLGINVYIIFSVALSGPEEIVLDGLVASHVPNNQSTLAGTIWMSDTIQTTDNTITTLSTIPTTSDSVILVQCTVVALEDVSNNKGGWQITRTYRNSGGVLSNVRGQDTLRFRNSAWNANLTTSGTDILLRVQGIAATNVSWKSSLYYTEHTY